MADDTKQDATHETEARGRRASGPDTAIISHRAGKSDLRSDRTTADPGQFVATTEPNLKRDDTSLGTRGGRFLRSLSTTQIAIGIVVSAVTAVGVLYPLVHHPSDHGVGAYRNLVRSTCDRVHAEATKGVDLGVPVFDDTTDGPQYQKAAVVVGWENAGATIMSEYAALNSAKVPSSLVREQQRAKTLEDTERSILDKEVDLLRTRLPDGLVTLHSVSSVLAPLVDSALPVRAQLDDALTTLAGAPCKVSPN